MEAQTPGTLAAAVRPSFGQEHFGALQVGDARLTRRAVISGEALLRHPGGTLPSKLSKAELLGFYDLANNPKTCHDNLLTAHGQRTRKLMEACADVVLIIHDTTEADYSGLDIPELGPIGNGLCWGLLVHNVLAMDYRNREALGLVGQFLHRRRKVKKGERLAAKRQHPQRESRLWVKGVEAVGVVPPGQRWVNLMDRGGDSFESMERQVTLGQQFVLRSKSNRCVQAADAAGRWRGRKLHDWARKLPRLDQRTVQVQANAQQPGREVVVAVGCGAVRVLAPQPRRGEHGNQPLRLWVVHVLELDPPAGVKPLEWILLSNVPTAAKAAAWERVDWYACRPMIEEYHKALKSGCSVEQLQFTTVKALGVAIALLSVVAVQLLRLRDLARRADAADQPARAVVDEIYVQVLSLWRFQAMRRDLSVKEFLYALARLGGHLGRRQDRPPGWLVLWRGWQELQRLVEGAQLVGLQRSG